VQGLISPALVGTWLSYVEGKSGRFKTCTDVYSILTLKVLSLLNLDSVTNQANLNPVGAEFSIKPESAGAWNFKFISDRRFYIFNGKPQIAEWQTRKKSLKHLDPHAVFRL
jgi:hypothetical protein